MKILLVSVVTFFYLFLHPIDHSISTSFVISTSSCTILFGYSPSQWRTSSISLHLNVVFTVMTSKFTSVAKLFSWSPDFHILLNISNGVVHIHFKLYIFEICLSPLKLMLSLSQSFLFWKIMPQFTYTSQKNISINL